MYVARIEIENFRCFGSAAVEFHPGVNVIIGENNSGKTALLAALRRVFGDQPRRRPELHDFFHGIADFTKAPLIEIAVILRSSNKDTSEDRALVATWLTNITGTWEAKLTYRCFLPDRDAADFVQELGQGPESSRFYSLLHRYLPKFVTRIYGGNPDDRLPVDSESLGRFHYQYLDALRDVQSDMFSGKDPLLREMLREVLDVGTTSDEARIRAEQFSGLSDRMSAHVKGRLDLNALFQLIERTGAGDGGNLTVDGKLGETDLLGALQLMVQKGESLLPVVCNGLGYNNLVYISLLLAKMDWGADERSKGENAVLFPMLAVEEPEAHLHPALQYKLLKYLRARIAEANRSRQVFITTHSTHITAACGLDDVICLSSARDHSQSPTVSYPARVYSDDRESVASKKYVERFLDATKSNMLFAKAVIFVEGLAELLVIPRLADRLALPLEDAHVAVVSVDGSTVKHFLPLFGAGDDGLRIFALGRSVACLVDADPSKRPKTSNAQWTSCWPPECTSGGTNEFEFKEVADVVKNLEAMVAGVQNIAVCYGKKTFEYDLAFANASCAELVTDSCAFSEELRELCRDPNSDPQRLRNRLDPELNALLASISDPDERARHLFAIHYLLSVGKEKGVNALDVASSLRDDFDAESPTVQLNVPDHIEKAIRFACTGPP